MYLGGPPLVKAATGEDAEEQSLGGAVMHTTKSGTCDQMAPDEAPLPPFIFISLIFFNFLSLF